MQALSTPPQTFVPPINRTRRILFTAIYLGILALFLLVGVEVISRRVFEPQTQSVYVTNELAYDPLVGWRGRRNFAATVTHGRYPAPIPLEINADGFRDGSWDVKLSGAATPGSKRILILGDSLLYGWANPPDGRLTEQLSALYRLDRRNVEVFNAGIPGYGPHNELRLLPELLARIRPHEVVLLFCTNDYGDAALPYDYRYPFRVYQPFFDSEARLLFNASVPRRPSLAMRDTVLGDLRLWYAVDQLRYAIEDRRYARYGIPNQRTAPLRSFEDLLGHPELRARFPYIEPTILAEYGRMAELSREAGARFTFFSSILAVAPSWERIEDMFRAKLEARGVGFLPTPKDEFVYGPWRPTLHDGHPNFIWAWIMANAAYAQLEGRPYELDFARMPQTPDIPTEIDLGNEPSSVRLLGLNWTPQEGGERRLAGPASFFVRRPTPGASELEITGWAPRPITLIASTTADRELCRLTLTLPVAAHRCPIAADPGPLVFVHLLPAAPLDANHLPAVRRIAVRTPGPS